MILPGKSSGNLENVTNMFFDHKNIHRYTREVASRQERSIIDYILVEQSKMHAVKDVRIKCGPEIGSDNHLLILEAKQRQGTLKSTEETLNTTNYETIKTY